MGLTVDLNKLIFNWFRTLDLHILSSLLHALHASAFLILKSFCEFIMYEPRYLKSGTCLMVLPAKETMLGSDSVETNSVLMPL